VDGHEIQIRVRYAETDAQGHVHHATYLEYFELGRTEMMRSAGRGYEELEREGLQLVVADIRCKYFTPVRFGDVLNLRTRVEQIKGARLLHSYELRCRDRLVARAESTLACVDNSGRVRRIPRWLSQQWPTRM